MVAFVGNSGGRPVPGVDHRVIGQAEQVLADVADQLIERAAREVGAADAAGEEGVAGENDAGVGAVIGQTASRMTLHVERDETQRAEHQFVAGVDRARCGRGGDGVAEEGRQVSVRVDEHVFLAAGGPDVGLRVGVVHGPYAGHVIRVTMRHQDGAEREFVRADGVGELLRLGWEAGVDNPRVGLVDGPEQVAVLAEAGFDKRLDVQGAVSNHGADSKPIGRSTRPGLRSDAGGGTICVIAVNRLTSGQTMASNASFGGKLDPASQRGRLEPVASGARIELIDVLRGFALLGILAVNMRYFAHTIYLDMTWLEPFPGRLDRFVRALVDLLCVGKFYSLFSFLFGFGAALQMMRAEQRGASFVRFFARRLLVLLLFGVLHVVLLWDGDVLIQYALLGFLLIPLRKCRPRNLLIVAGPIILLSVVGTMVYMSQTWRDFPFPKQDEPAATTEEFTPDEWLAELEAEEQVADERPDYNELARESYLTHRYGTYGDTIAQRVFEYWDGLYFMMLYMDPHVLGMFLIGWFAARRRILHDPNAHRTLLHRVLAVGLIVGLLGNVTMVWIEQTASVATGPWIWVLQSVAYAVGATALCLFYIAAITLLMLHPVWQRRLHPLAWVGRMALTNYLLQSLICTLLFNGYGVGLYGEVGPAVGLVLTVVIYAAQIPLSAAWFGRYRFGPAEWLWRTLSYGRAQPMLRRAAD